MTPHLSIPAPRPPGDDAPPAVRPADPRLVAPPAPAGALTLLEQGRRCLRDAELADRPADRCVFAHLAALRAATAVVVSRSWRRTQRWPCRAARSAGVWRQLADVAPELREWSAHFAAGAVRRAAAEAGSPGVTPGEAELALRHAADFLEVVGRSLPGAAR